MGYRLFLSSGMESGIDSLLADTGLLACELTQIIELCATHLTDLVDFDAVDSR